MLTFRKLEAFANKELARHVKPYGFAFDRKLQDHIRFIPGGRQSIGLVAYDMLPLGVDLQLTGATRLDPVEELYHQFSETEPQFWAASETLTFNCIAPFGNGLLKQVRVSSEEDVVQLISEWQSIITDRMIPFLDQHKDVESIERVFNGPDWLLPRGPGCTGCMRAIILAKLAQNPTFEALVAAYHPQIPTDPKEYDTKFGFIQSVEFRTNFQAKYDRLTAHLRESV